MKRLYLSFSLLLLAITTMAQMENPAHFTTTLKHLGNGEAEIVFTGKIDKGWHVYSTDLGQSGPIEAKLHADKMDGAKLVGKLQARGNETTKYDNMFDMTLRYFEGAATFAQKIRFTKPTYDIECRLEYGACSDQMCIPPSYVSFKEKGNAPLPTDKEDKASDPAPKVDTVGAAVIDSVAAAADSIAADTTATVGGNLWQPVVKELKAYDNDVKGSSSLWYIFIAGLVGGFVALLTPCVWPIIPMTVSFFLKRNKDRRHAIADAATYGVSIVVIYVLLGLVVTLIFGASKLNELSTNAVFNIFFFLLLILFAASFFGAFELTLPSSWANEIDQKSESASGLISIFLMAFTLTLVSFSCTGPIIGSLLVMLSSKDSIVGPMVGMLGFALALALPFTLFALFPNMLKSVPKSGGWMNVIKVTLGFVELAFALKFLSVADLAYGWHLLDREVFVSLWIVIFVLLGVYLLGWLKFPHDEPEHKTNVPQFFLGLLSLAFAVYMIPGLWGAPLKAISAFAPPMNTQDFNLYGKSVEARFTDYEAGMAAAKAEGKPVMIDFTGFGCVNCRKMEAAVWTDPQVADLLNNKYVLISLYVDDKTPLGTPMTALENGKEVKLYTVGDKWSYLQRNKFGANTQPFYVLIDNDGKPLNKSRSYDENIAEYVEYLQQGVNKYYNK